MDKELKLTDKILIAASYVFAFPSLYMILSEKRKDRQLAFHAAQALLLWLLIAALLVILRIVVNFVLSSVNIPLLDRVTGLAAFIFWLYGVYCAALFLQGKDVKIPLIAPLADRLA